MAAAAEAVVEVDLDDSHQQRHRQQEVEEVAVLAQVNSQPTFDSHAMDRLIKLES